MAPGGDRLGKLISLGEFAAMLVKSEVPTAGRHECLPYSKGWVHFNSTNTNLPGIRGKPKSTFSHNKGLFKLIWR